MKKQLLFILLLLTSSISLFAQTTCSALFSYTINSNGTVTLVSANAATNSSNCTYWWSLGNGAMSTGTQTTANYNNVGSYSVCLYVNDTINNCSDSTCQTIVISSISTCNANFTYTVDTNGVANFIATGSATNPSTCIYAWNLGNGNFPSGTNVSTTYALGQTYPVTLTVTDPVTSCQNTTWQQVNVVSTTGCNSSFTYLINPNGLVTLSASNVNGNNSYSWSHGNGTNSFGTQTSVTYNSFGTYNICLVVSDSMNTCWDSTCHSITIAPTNPTCDASFSYLVNSLGTAVFTAMNAASNPASTMYSWSFDNGTTWTNLSSSSSITNSFTTGISTAVLLAIANQGNTCVDTSSQLINIPGTLNCTAGFYIYPDSMGAPHTYVGVNTSTGMNLTYTWIWGDGTSSTGQYPSHTYSAAGTYNICLIVNGNGCVDSFCLNSIINKTTADIYSVTFNASPAGVGAISKTKISLYPNPANNEFVLDAPKADLFIVKLFDLNGRLLFTKNVQGQEKINITSLQNGIYATQIIDAKGSVSTSKLLKQ
jgi:PKD repeat protein